VYGRNRVPCPPARITALTLAVSGNDPFAGTACGRVAVKPRATPLVVGLHSRLIGSLIRSLSGSTSQAYVAVLNTC
jgi:hypothetical protein